MPKLTLKKILIYHKTSIYQHLLDQRQPLSGINLNSKFIHRIKTTHVKHYTTVAGIEKFLKKEGLSYHKAKRGEKVDFSKFDLIITIGGDGTLLEAAHYINDQLILSINSDPAWSIGHLCGGDNKSFGKLIHYVILNKFKIRLLHRLNLKIKRKTFSIKFLNDILICHSNPAAMSHYVIRFKGKEEEHKNSGVWVATAAGSTGAVHSAGGKILPLTSKLFQYQPRELYYGKKYQYRLTGGLISPRQSIRFVSLMKDGLIYIDGAHEKISFPIGEEATITQSSQPLKTISF